MHDLRKILKSLKRSSLALLLALALTSCSQSWEQILASGSDKAPPPELTFAVVGDVMAHMPQIHAAWYDECRCYNFYPVFEPIAHYIHAADIAIANFETTLPGDPRQFSGYPDFGAPDQLAEALRDTGFNILTTANNHSVDKGRSGLIRTVEIIRELGMQPLGTYSSMEEYEAERIYIHEENDIRVALLSYTYGTNGIPVPRGTHVNLIDKEAIARDIADARAAEVDGVILLYHFGAEYIREPDNFQLEMVEFAFDEGVDIVLGGHPHVLQPFRIFPERADRNGEVRQRLVAYSLGNFISNQQHRRYTDGGKIFRFTISPNQEGPGLQFYDIDYIPVWVYRRRTPGPMRYFVLPIEEYLDNDHTIQLTDAAMRQMLLFYNDTTSHLAESRKEVAPFMRVAKEEPLQ